MKTPQQLRELLDKLTVKGIGDAPDFPDIEVSPPTFMRDDGVLRVSGEQEVSSCWLDYYGQFRGDCAWIHPTLEAFAKEHGGFWEWDSPASISFWR